MSVTTKASLHTYLGENRQLIELGDYVSASVLQGLLLEPHLITVSVLAMGKLIKSTIIILPTTKLCVSMHEAATIKMALGQQRLP